MVALITNGHSTDWRGRPFRHRNRLPGLILAAVLVVIVAIVWTLAFSSDGEDASATACNAPDPGGAPLGRHVDGSIKDVDPAPLADTRIRVFNANGQSGQAAHVAAGLSDIGFHPAADNAVSNDPVYLNQALQCQGQIRFGAQGEAAASALWLVVPCAELIRDDRADATVDLALGTLFHDLSTNSDAEAVLKALRVPQGGPAPEIDPALIEGAHNVRC
ncbi:envelope integrity protein Cei [Tomitella fengzijianii]|uniref:LytR family transcriptional regulator n=1 Tax=Tomitella fengzijianii TaxID=2597660 RepID=A0A516X3E8_9ACTN|nr:envelope integrity protein Cei [Tomitella fengzijianii]QDQ97602.1 LytR family transcriptional regulator [Tomitella fengzijianii]